MQSGHTGCVAVLYLLTTRQSKISVPQKFSRLGRGKREKTRIEGIENCHEKGEETAADVSGCVFSVLSQKVKIKTQNELTGHPSASLSVYKDVKIIIKISKQCFEAVKCEYSAFKVPILVLAPGPLFVLSAIVPKVVQKVLQNSFFDRSFSSQVFKSSGLQVKGSSFQVKKSS